MQWTGPVMLEMAAGPEAGVIRPLPPILRGIPALNFSHFADERSSIMIRLRRGASGWEIVRRDTRHWLAQKGIIGNFWRVYCHKEICPSSGCINSNQVMGAEIHWRNSSVWTIVTKKPLDKVCYCDLTGAGVCPHRGRLITLRPAL